MAGEEVVGGVVGFLRMDISDFERDMLKALALVKALDGQDINVDIKTNSKSVERDLAGAGRAAKGAAREVDGMGSSFKGLRDPRLIVGAIGAGMALLGPVTGAATAAMGGFVGVVGTAALAFVGFKHEVEQGTALGKTLQSGLDDIKGAFGDLGTTAARAMQGDILDSMSQVSHFLPTLNGDVDELAGHLGKALNISTKGLLSGLTNMMPLLQDGGKYAEILAQKFADFTASQDFKDFIDYARRELPNVGSAIGSLAGGIKDLAVALAPAGDSLVELINLTGKAASGISGMVEAASQLPTGLGVLSQLGKDTDGVNKAMLAVNPTAVLFADRLGLVRDKTDLATDAVAAHTSSLSFLSGAQSATAAALGTTDQALNAAREAQGKHTQAAKDATLQMQVEGDAAGLLKQQLDKLNGKAISVASSQNAFDSALANSNKHIAANGKTIDRATTSLAGNSAAAVANRGELIRQVTAAEGVATAMRDNGASQDETRAKMIKMKDEIKANAKAHGLNATEVQKFIDKIYQIPKKVAPTKLEVQTAGAFKEIAAFQKAIDALHGKTVTAKVRYAYSGKLPNGGVSKQGGSTFDAGAQGGLISNGIKRYDGGGLISGPGTGTSDSILAAISGTQEMIRVANGEFISTDASRRRNRAALEAGNKGATLAPVGAAHGAPVELGAATIAAIAAQMRHVNLHPVVTAGSFDRAMGGQLR